jgi:hypothetical protein
MSKIKMNMSVMDALVEMSEGNPGAATVLAQIMQRAEEIDPDIPMNIIPIMMMDDMGIYGSRIWQFYKDFCKEDIPNLLAVLRAHQHGFLDERKINHAIDNWGSGVDLDRVMSSVQEVLPEFNRR